MQNINSKIIKRLFEMQDLKYKEFHSKLCPGTENIIGVQVPKLRKIAKDLATSNGAKELITSNSTKDLATNNSVKKFATSNTSKEWQEFLDNTENKYYEETMIEGLLIGYLKIPLQEKIKYIEKFIPKIDNWAICDTFSSNLRVKSTEREELWTFLQKYVSSKNEFEVRFIVVMWLFHFMEDKYIDKIFAQLENLYNEKYYIKMAIAWLLSIGLIKQKEKTLKYLEKTKLDDFTYNKALQKAIESYRVSDVEKEMYRSMKRK